MYLKFVILALSIFLTASVQGQNEYIEQLERQDILLDSSDKNWLIDNNSFLIDMAGLAKIDTSAMNKAIIQMSTKLLSNQLVDISEDQAKGKKEVITKIIYGALEHHGLEEEKMLSAMSWYHMIVREIKI